mmetsp:Transcript_24236/g.35912  ORF Transcript_24236/g.35912 Transcript_24236/m.35912 type:complete len:705 (+) Transcript_24236:123-2237(+)|eukprot:CAMPEP_0194214448 /NCGR_PEP_ID=MMETSP0156-20130528/15626_1 /TAXON_ID=33649 /ORGANISM="Thalassionema nitzschioides, Strain L26-B" /LENGTH=704 /DNA_ID=CAMNT_0038942695 /DNA_START=31 /DNA_END=2145 /DNA_ORIENTATION=-
MRKRDALVESNKAESVIEREPPKEDDEEEEEDERIICCSLCYCSADYSDKSYFCQQARDADSDLEGEQPKLLPLELFNAHNALVFCDSCDRPYHQRCHFIPVINLPRGKWHCFICTSTPQLVSNNQTKNKERKTKKQQEGKRWTKSLIEKALYQMEKEAGDLEQKWEFDVRAQKSVAFKAEMRRLRGGLSQQLQNIRLAQMSLKAYTTGRRTLSTTALLKSQELSQTTTKLNSAKLRVRQLLQSLEKYMKGDDVEWKILMEFIERNPGEAHVWFPFGKKQRRQQPRLQDEESVSPGLHQNGIPQQINVDSTALIKTQIKKQHSEHHKTSSSTTIPAEDDDSGISLDNLKCCSCLRGEATDENDLLLCDGVGCFRAYHMHCLSPIMTPDKAAAEDDWFCPICTALAKLVAEVQSEYIGDEWHNDEDGSIISWDQVNDVFPEAEKEYEMTIKWKNNQIDEETKRYLTAMFGDDDDKGFEVEEDQTNLDMLQEEDDEDDDFDPEQKNKDGNDSASENDDDSSNATLQDLSSVELRIEQRELNALSEGGSSDSDSSNEGSTQRRRSRRIRSTRSSRANTDDDETGDEKRKATDIGALDESNIVQGKRRRRKIDYRLLNDSMFGKLSTKEKKMIDDQDDFQYKAPMRSASSPSDDSSQDDTNEEAIDTEDSTTEEISGEERSQDQRQELDNNIIKSPVKKRPKTKRLAN